MFDGKAGGDVVGDVVTSEGDDCEFAQNVVGVDADGGGISTDVHKGAARAFLAGTELGVGEGEGSYEKLGDVKSCSAYAFLDVLGQGGTGNDIEETSFELVYLHAYDIEYGAIANFVFLWYDFEYL